MPLSTRQQMITLSVLLMVIQNVIADASSFQQNAGAAADALMTFYDQDTGLWDDGSGTLWWNSANSLTAMIDLAAVDAGQKEQYQFIIATTFANAPAANPHSTRKRSLDGVYSKEYVPRSKSDIVQRMVKRQSEGFLNGFYDDEGWWALAWLDAYDLTGTIDHLNTAVGIWQDMKGGQTTSCGDGSIWWNKKHSYVATIANELYFHVSASLANRVGSNTRQMYVDEAQKSWNWLRSSGIIGSNNLLVDGVDSSCNPTGTIFTYNQGVILGALVEMSKCTGENSYLAQATLIANAATEDGGPLVTQGILHEGNNCEANNGCGADGNQFKGVFVRNLRKLQLVQPNDNWKAFLQTNARSIWQHNLQFQGDNTMLGPSWSGPFVGSANAPAQTSALECLTAAFVTAT